MSSIPSQPDPLPLAQITAELLPEVYALLSQICRTSEADSAYVRALCDVIDTSGAAEQRGAPMCLLALLACQAAGGEIRRAMPVAAAWRALHIAAKLLDDVEDGDVARMSPLAIDSARIVNLASGFIVMASLALERVGDESWRDLQHAFNVTVLHMAGGQHVDICSAGAADLQEYFKMIAAKSGIFFALAARAGARCATTDRLRLDRFERFGHHVGMMLQVGDDLQGLRRPPGKSDLANGHSTLPVLFALSVAPADERARLKQLLAQAPGDQAAEVQASQMIRSLGAEMYLWTEMIRYRQQATLALEACASEHPLVLQPLYGWLDNLLPSQRNG